MLGMEEREERGRDGGDRRLRGEEKGKERRLYVPEVSSSDS